MDLYSNFAELAAKEKERRDYRIRVNNLGTPVVVIAPHGGAIEPGTSEIAKAIAGDHLSMYAFEGLRQRSGELHITSHRFDEPVCVKLVSGAQAAIAIHGRRDEHDPETVWLGGLDVTLGKAVAISLRKAGFRVDAAPIGMAARDATNICNRGSAGAGVQLELPRTLRDELARDEVALRSFSEAVRQGIQRQ